jgi:orotidine-5'-phosphate decarboxylase
VPEIVLALDLPGPEARRLLDRLPALRWVKVGPVLFTREGPGLVRELVARGLRVFLDLKWHDIPQTVAGAVEAARGLGASMATVHTLGGAAMLEAAVRASGAGGLGLVGVTVLTAHSPESYGATVGRGQVGLADEVVRLARLAVQAGLQGVVCSALEAGAVRRAIGPDRWIVVPGIRRPGDPVGDQVRTATPAEAVTAGATHLVVGRPILQAPDPGAALAALMAALDGS